MRGHTCYTGTLSIHKCVHHSIVDHFVRQITPEVGRFIKEFSGIRFQILLVNENNGHQLGHIQQKSGLNHAVIIH